VFERHRGQQFVAVRLKRPSCRALRRRAAEQRDELMPILFDEIAFDPCQPWTGLQDTDFAAVSQRARWPVCAISNTAADLQGARDRVEAAERRLTTTTQAIQAGHERDSNGVHQGLHIKNATTLTRSSDVMSSGKPPRAIS